MSLQCVFFIVSSVVYNQQFTFTVIKAREISQFLHLYSGLIQIRFVAAEMIGHCSTLCVHAGLVWRLRSDKAVENPRLERKRGEQARHWASALEHHADQGSQRDGRSPLKGLCWAKCFSPFMHGNKMLAVTVSAGFYDLFVLLSLLNLWVPFFRGPEWLYIYIFVWLLRSYSGEFVLEWHQNNIHPIQSSDNFYVSKNLSVCYKL